MAKKQLNHNNPLVWFEADGFQKPPFSVIANGDNIGFAIGLPYVIIYPLTNDSATYGIAEQSFELLSQDNPKKPAVWDTLKKKLTYYPPDDAQAGQTRELLYRFKDTRGNLSNTAKITIAINAQPSLWRGINFVCLKDGEGNNTGKGFYRNLEKYNLLTGLAVVPAVTKPNIEGDANYIPPADSAQCPLPTEVLRMAFFNQSPNPSDTIMAVGLFNNGVSVKGIFIDLRADQTNQPELQPIPPGTYEEMRVTVRLMGGVPRGVRFTAGQGGSGSTSVQANPGGDLNASIDVKFYNVTFGEDYAGDIILK